MTAEVIVETNQKGGVGKTTTAFHQLRAAVLRGLRVLAVDLDPQGNLTSVITAEPFSPDQVGIADVLSSQAGETLRDVIVPSIWEGLDVVPSNGAPLAAVQRELVGVSIGREQRLRTALQPVLEDYDLIIIDCGPSIDLLTTNALVAADSVVIVSEATLFSINGLSQVLASVNEIRAYYNPGLTIAGVVVNNYRANTGTVTAVQPLITNDRFQTTHLIQTAIDRQANAVYTGTTTATVRVNPSPQELGALMSVAAWPVAAAAADQCTATSEPPPGHQNATWATGLTVTTTSTSPDLPASVCVRGYPTLSTPSPAAPPATQNRIQVATALSSSSGSRNFTPTYLASIARASFSTEVPVSGATTISTSRIFEFEILPLHNIAGRSASLPGSCWNIAGGDSSLPGANLIA